MAIIRYCEELRGDKPELSKKAICEKSSNIFNIHWTSALKICDHFKTTKCIQPRKIKQSKVDYKTDVAFYYIKDELGTVTI
ncbi:hypothetical protein MTP99_004909 [Tenebrio molitor]|nr:hypothetical protein MTP99_004909 [Tenebrio molitor]CAH1380931.1 unnamed protein product [Tenebrio molitor]